MRVKYNHVELPTSMSAVPHSITSIEFVRMAFFFRTRDCIQARKEKFRLQSQARPTNETDESLLCFFFEKFGFCDQDMNYSDFLSVSTCSGANETSWKLGFLFTLVISKPLEKSLLKDVIGLHKNSLTLNSDSVEDSTSETGEESLKTSDSRGVDSAFPSKIKPPKKKPVFEEIPSGAKAKRISIK